MRDKVKAHFTPVLRKRNAGYAVAAGAIGDILMSLFRPEYAGVFSGIAAILTGGANGP